MPLACASTALVPNIRTGVYRGRIKIAVSTLLNLVPIVRDAPTAPIMVNNGVAIESVITNVAISEARKYNILAINGDSKIIGKQLTIQFAIHFAITKISVDIGLVSIISKLPSS